MTDLRVPPFEITIDDVDYVCEQAVVERFYLGLEDHKMFVADIAFAGPSWGQSLAPRALDTFDPTTRTRVGTAFGCEFIMECVRVLGSPETAKGQRVVVFRHEPYGLIEGFAALADDGSIGEPFLPVRLVAKHFPDTP